MSWNPESRITKTPEGFVFLAPNEVVSGVDFHVSFNNRDIGSYGAVTTALVYGQEEAFYILNGDHREAYDKLIPQGWDVCFDYFNRNREQMNPLSDTGSPDEVKARFRKALDQMEERRLMREQAMNKEN